MLRRSKSPLPRICLPSAILPYSTCKMKGRFVKNHWTINIAVMVSNSCSSVIQVNQRVQLCMFFNLMIWQKRTWMEYGLAVIWSPALTQVSSTSKWELPQLWSHKCWQLGLGTLLGGGSVLNSAGIYKNGREAGNGKMDMNWNNNQRLDWNLYSNRTQERLVLVDIHCYRTLLSKKNTRN